MKRIPRWIVIIGSPVYLIWWMVTHPKLVWADLKREWNEAYTSPPPAPPPRPEPIVRQIDVPMINIHKKLPRQPRSSSGPLRINPD